MTDNLIVLGKYILAAVVGFLLSLHAAVAYLLLFMLLDYISGMLAGAIRGELSSDIGIMGLRKKVMVLVLVVGAHTAQLAMQSLGGMEITALGIGVNFGAVVAILFMINELISITENAARAGIEVPPQLLELLEEGKRMDFWRHHNRRKSAVPNPAYKSTERRKKWRGGGP